MRIARRTPTKAHRYAIALEHHKVERLVRVPAHRFWRFAWGNAEKPRTFKRTELAFSRRNTATAIALREQLARRGLLP